MTKFTVFAFILCISYISIPQSKSLVLVELLEPKQRVCFACEEDCPERSTWTARVCKFSQKYCVRYANVTKGVKLPNLVRMDCTADKDICLNDPKCYICAKDFCNYIY